MTNKAKRVCPIKGGGGGGAEGAVSYADEQSLTKIQKDRARKNIGAVSQEELSGKANKDGYYSKMTVGAAESLVGGNDTSREFTEDTAGGTADIADGIVQVERIKGNSIILNNLANKDNISSGTQDGITYIVNADGTILVNGTATTQIDIVLGRIDYHKDHYYYYLEQPAGASFDGYMIRYVGDNTNIAGDYYKQLVDDYWTCVIRIIAGTVADNVLFKPLVIDVTKMLGAGNEPSTVEEFEAMFPLDYYDYNAGTIINLNPTGIKTQGFNAYNPTTGKAYAIGGKQYQITGAYTSIAEGDTAITPDSDGLFTPTKNGELTIVGGDSTTTCVHLVWSGVRNGEYEQHWEETRNIDVASIMYQGSALFPDGLCSVGAVYDEITPTKAIKRIGSRAHEEGDEDDTSVLTDGTTTLYVLETPIDVVFDTPIYLNYRVSDFGTETLLPINTAIPTTTPIKLDVVYGLNVVDFVRNADKNYLTIEDTTGMNGSSFANLRSALSTAFGIDIVPTYDATNKRYTFAITDNRKVEVPASATASGLKGTWAEDEEAVYICTETNVWVKINKETW